MQLILRDFKHLFYFQLRTISGVNNNGHVMGHYVTVCLHAGLFYDTSVFGDGQLISRNILAPLKWVCMMGSHAAPQWQPWPCQLSWGYTLTYLRVESQKKETDGGTWPSFLLIFARSSFFLHSLHWQLVHHVVSVLHISSWYIPYGLHSLC